MQKAIPLFLQWFKRFLGRPWCRWAIFLSTLFCIQFFCRKATDDFTLLSIEQALPESAQIADVGNGEALNQPFYYLGSGAQCFVFVSEDQRYVLKFFKHSILDHSPLLNKMLPEFLQHKRNHRRAAFLKSSEIAIRQLREETGILYAHMEKEEGIPPTLHLIDRLGIHHQVETSSLPFLLQTNSLLIHKALPHLTLAQQCAILDRLIALTSARCKKGIADADPFLTRNFGLIDDRVIEFDIGAFAHDPMLQFPEHAQRELYFTLTAFQRHLGGRFPLLVDYLQQKIDHLVEEIR
jgi:hypothetical protein